MKKFTLLIAMLFCVIGFGQNASVAPTSVQQTDLAEKSVLAKQAIVEKIAGYSTLSELPQELLLGKARNAAAYTKKAVSNAANSDKSATGGTRTATALNVTKANNAVQKTAMDPVVSALLKRLSSKGNEAGTVADIFTQNEQVILRNHFAGKKTMIFDADARVSGPLGNHNFTASTSAANRNVTTPVVPTRNPGVVITHSATQNITPLNSVTCNAGGIPTENHFYRDFDLTNDFGITGNFVVSDVEFAVEAVSGPVGLTLNIWSSNGAFPGGVLTLQGSAGYTSNVADALTVVSVPVAATIPAGENMVYELVINAGATASWFPGSNADGQTGPSYIAAADCGLPNPTDLAAIGFPNQHMVMNVIGKDDSGGGGGGGPCASPIIEVNQDFSNACMAFISQTDIAQGYQPVEANNAGAGFHFESAPSAGTTFTVTLYDDLPPNGGVAVATGSTVADGSAVWLDVFWDVTTVVPGNQYFLVVTGTADACMSGSLSDIYPGGNVYANPGFQSFPQFDYTFRTYSCDGGGGGGTTDCSLVGPGNGFENGKSCTWELGRLVAHDITVAADSDMVLESILANVFIGASGSGVNAAFVDVHIYDDAGGQPGTEIATELGVIPTSQTVVGSNFGFDIWAVALDIADVNLASQPGVDTTYWIGISLSATDGSNNFWENSTAGLIGFGEAYNDGLGGGYVIDSTLEGVYTFTATCDGGGGGGGGCATGVYTDRASFDAEAGALPVEDLAGGPGFLSQCGVVISEAGDSCFPAGEILPGIEITSNNSAGDQTVYVDPADGFGNTIPVVGSNAFLDYTIINFPNNDVNSFGFELITLLGTGPVEVRIFGAGGLIDTQSVNGTNPESFWGYIASETVVSVEIEDLSGVNVELIGNIAFGLCEGGGGGGGGDCSVTGPSNGFENGKSCTFELGRSVAHDIEVPADSDMTLESITPRVFIGAQGSGVNAAFVDVRVYADAGGQPGAEVASQLGLAPTSQTVVGSNFGFDVWAVELDIADIALPGQAGVPTTYWIGISVSATDGSNNFWENSTAGLIGFGEAYNDGLGGGFVIDSTLEGAYTFTASCEDIGGGVTFDDCEGALPIECGESILGSSIGATPDNAPECDTSTQPGVWYKFVDDSGLPGDYVLTTCSANTDYDTKISVYSGSCTDLICVVGNDDDPNCPNFQTTVEFSSDGATTFYILVHGFAGATGNFELSLECNLIPPPNDEIQNAIDLDEVGCPFTDENVAMPAATTEDGTPSDCDITGANGVWYVFTPELDGFITGTIATPAGFSSVTFYTAPDETSTEDELVLVDWWQNQCLPSESATIPLVAGQAYYCFVVNSGGVTDIIFDNCQLGVASNEIEGFAFYPNPTNDRINLSSVQTIEKVTLYNILGQKLIDLNVNATTSELSVSHLAAGAYLMEVTVDGQKGIYKVMKR